MRTAVEMIAEFRRQDPARFAWKQPPYEYEHDKQPIDVLYGSDQLRLTIDRDADVGALARSWEPEEEAFRKLRQPFLIY